MKSHLYLILLLFSILSVAAQTKTKKYPRERIYLQTDKEFYLAGELLWIKAISTNEEGKPIELSKVTYVELLDQSSSQMQIKLEMINSVGQGMISLPVTLETGYYRLIGYTHYMQNEGERVFFEKWLPIINTFDTDKILNISEDSISSSPNLLKIERNISLYTDNSSYSTRDQGEIYLRNIPQDIHTLSLSISGVNLMDIPSNATIDNWYKQLSSPTDSFSGKFIAEYEGHILSGKLIDISTGKSATIKEKPIVLLGFVGNDIRLFGGKIDNKANVKYYTARISGTQEIATTVISSSLTRYRVDLTSPFVSHSPKKSPDFVIRTSWLDQLAERSIALQVLHSYAADSLIRSIEQEPYFQWKPDWKYPLDNYTRFTTMEEVIIEFIPGLRFRRINNQRILSILTEERVGYTADNPLVLLDGIPISDHNIIFNYNPLLIHQINVYKGRYYYGGVQFNGIASFQTYNNNYPSLIVPETTQLFDYDGTQNIHIFYTPSYEIKEERDSRIPDFRHTLLWIPDMSIENQSSISIPFTTSDLKGKFIITIEGLTKNGQPVYGTTFIIVN